MNVQYHLFCTAERTHILESSKKGMSRKNGEFFAIAIFVERANWRRGINRLFIQCIYLFVFSFFIILSYAEGDITQVNDNNEQRQRRHIRISSSQKKDTLNV